MAFNHKRADFWLPNFGFKRSLVSQPLKVSSQSRKFEFNVFGIIHLNGHNF